ncbi:MAG: hypothetical protein ACHQYP_03740 [Nitrospiria bacterium]
MTDLEMTKGSIDPKKGEPVGKSVFAGKEGIQKVRELKVPAIVCQIGVEEH